MLGPHVKSAQPAVIAEGEDELRVPPALGAKAAVLPRAGRVRCRERSLGDRELRREGCERLFERPSLAFVLHAT